MKRAIITGATGAVGTALTKELIKNDIEVLVFCREGSERNTRIPQHHLVNIKYCDISQLESVENDTGKQYDVFYHFAWKGTTGSGRNDMYMQNSNVKYALDAVGAAKRFGCKMFIGAGSQAEYGRFEGKLNSNTPTFPENCYGMAKLCAGQMTRVYAEFLDLKHIWVRILSVYGINDGMQSMVMSTILKLKNGEVPQFTKGEQMWDYLYNDDAAKAFRLLGESKISGKTYVLGSGKARPLSEYIEEIRKTVNDKASINLGAIEYAKNQVMYLCADTSDLEKDIGWRAETDFKTGIKSIYDALRRRKI